ncbi:hypothetical protein MPOCJGCO_0041 [Methylobacterium trifolii]|uniref:Uncharacterized protein n=1 Tax=Methylobacterium trifolii TaxID=1003092 RepID=A0ABQ4TWI7_9HYPH|nr:hypothetical protein MPOCJGCO_0041 [Methylobacterium trifolii]
MSGWVTVTGPPRAICALNTGTTEPTEPSTLPKRTAMSRVGWPGSAACSASRAWATISAKRLVTPSCETGSIALSVEIMTRARAPAAIVARATLIEPKTLVLMPSSQSCSR